MNTSAYTHRPSPAAPAPSGVLQRQCSCGGSCDSCNKKKRVQRKAGGVHEHGVPPIVHDVLRTPGQSLDASTRAFMEPRFGFDFGSVRIHTDARAAESAHAVNALAYTVGNDVVFGAGQYNASSASGRKLLAHELTHVTQHDGGSASAHSISDPSDASERAAEHASEAIAAGTPPQTAPHAGHAGLQRTVGSQTDCPANKNGTSADPQGDLKAADSRAKAIATTASTLCAADPASADTLKIFERRFGLPPATKGGFMNRLTGATVAKKDDAIKGELGIMSKRYAMVARMFGQPVAYRCIGGAATFGGCSPPTCAGAFAWSCRGVGAIFLCPTTWNSAPDADQRGAVLVHEAFHINFGVSNPGKIGEVGDATLKGPGRNFDIADCCSGFAADLSKVVNPADSCPAAP